MFLVRSCYCVARYHALVMIDECHATGMFGATGRGTPEYCGVEGRVDIINSTMGKALGGAMVRSIHCSIHCSIHFNT